MQVGQTFEFYNQECPLSRVSVGLRETSFRCQPLGGHCSVSSIEPSHPINDKRATPGERGGGGEKGEDGLPERREPQRSRPPGNPCCSVKGASQASPHAARACLPCSPGCSKGAEEAPRARAVKRKESEFFVREGGEAVP